MFGKKKKVVIEEPVAVEEPVAIEEPVATKEKEDKIEASLDRIEALVAEIKKEQNKILRRLTRKTAAMYEGSNYYGQKYYSFSSSNEGFKEAFYEMESLHRERERDDIISTTRRTRKSYRLGRFIESECEA